MSRKNNRPQFHEPVSSGPTTDEPVEVVVVEVFDPLEDSIEVGEVILVDGTLEGVSLGDQPYSAGGYGTSRADDFGAPAPAFRTAPETGALGGAVGAAKDAVADKAQDAVQGATQVAQDVGQKAQDVVQDVTKTAQDAVQGVAAKTQDVAGKAQDVAQDVAGKAQDVANSVSGKAQDAAQGVVQTAQDVTQKVADKASTAKAAAGDALDSAKAAVPAAKGVLGSAASKISAAGATGVQSAGSALWLLFQRNPLQAIFVISGLVWLFRSNKAAASQPPVSITDAAGDAAEKVGSVAGHVQVAATNLSGQVSGQASRGASWFSKTLHENPLAVGAMAIVFGAGLGFSVPESGYENKLLGKTRDGLADKVQAAAQDLTQKVTAVAQTTVQEAVETVKTEAKNQGLSGELTPESAAQDLAKVAGKAQDALQNITDKVTAAAADEAQKQGLTAEGAAPQSQDQSQSS